MLADVFGRRKRGTNAATEFDAGPYTPGSAAL